MNHYWILLPILGAVGYSLSRFIRNYLIDTAFNKKNVSAFTGMTAGAYVLIAVTIFAIFGPKVLALDFWSIIGMFIAGALMVFSQYPAFKALKIAETVEVTIFSQCGPVLALIFGFIFLQQEVLGKQLMGFLLIMAAALLLVFAQETKSGKKLKAKTAGLMVASSAFWFLSDVVIMAVIGNDKANSSTLNYMRHFFYFEIGAIITVVISFLMFPSWRATLKRKFFAKKGTSKNLTFSLVNNIIYAAAEVFYKIALVMSPAIALLAVVDQVAQLIITFILGIVLSWLFPALGREKLNKRLVTRHLIAAVLVGMGIILVG